MRGARNHAFNRTAPALELRRVEDLGHLGRWHDFGAAHGEVRSGLGGLEDGRHRSEGEEILISGVATYQFWFSESKFNFQRKKIIFKNSKYINTIFKN